MTTWFYKTLGDGMTADEPADQIRVACQTLLDASGGSADFAVFTRAESEGHLHCEVIAYFSPAAAQVAKAFDAKPCAPPMRAGLGLLAGNPQCWAVLFPESQPY